MSYKQIFPSSAVYYFLKKEIVNNNPEFDKRFLMCESLDSDTLIKKYRSLENIPDKDNFFKSKLPIIGHTRNTFKRFEGYGQRNLFKVKLSYDDILEFTPEFRKFLNLKENSSLTLYTSLVEINFDFLVLCSDIDILEQYEQAYSNRLFLSNIKNFTFLGSELGLGSSFNLNYNAIWNDLDDFQISLSGMAFNAFKGSSKLYGMLMFSNEIPQYIIKQINVEIWEKTSLTLVDSFVIQ